MEPPATIKDLLEAGAARFGGAPAVIGPSGALTYAQLAERAGRIAETLDRLLPARSERIAVQVAGKLSLCQALYGIAAHGRSAMVCSEEVTPEQLRAVLERYRPAALVLERGALARAAGALAGYDGFVFALSPAGALDPVQGPVAAVETAGAGPAGPPAPDDEALILFTSGTTGEKKAVPITHRNLIETARMINRFMGVDRPITEFVTVPLSHAFGLRRVICLHLVGGAVVVEDGPFNPARAIQALRDRACTGLSAVPGVLAVMRAAFDAALREAGPQVEFIELGSAPLSAQGKAELCELFPKAQISMHYGLTEASKVTFLHFSRDAHKLHTVGRPSPGLEVKLAAADGREVPPGGVGEVWARGYSVATGYLRDEALTRERFVDGWFRTGDLARMDAEGYLELVGRADDQINVGGKKLYPLEVEQRLKDLYPDIDCAVGAEEHDLVGARPVLYYSQSTPVGPALFRDMVARLAPLMEPYKLPVRAVSVPAIPRTGNGKVIRRDLARAAERPAP